MPDFLREDEMVRLDDYLIEPARIRTGIDRIHIEAALALDIHGSFRKAADALNMKPGTVNRRIRDLEFQIGVPIFERSRRRTVATRIGRMFLRHSGHMLVNFHSMIEGIRRVADGRAGEVAIGCSGPIMSGPVHELIFGSQHRLGDIRPYPVELSHDSLLDALASARIDLAVMRGGVPKFRGQSMPLWEDRILIGLPCTHPLARHSALRWADLAALPFILSSHGPDQAIQRLLSARTGAFGNETKTIVRDVSQATVLQMVAAGHGACLCAESSVDRRSEGIVFRELLGVDGLARATVFACWLPDHENPALARLLQELEKLGTGTGVKEPGSTIVSLGNFTGKLEARRC